MNRIKLRLIGALLYLLCIILYISQGILFEGTWFTFFSGFYVLGYGIFSALFVLKSKKHPGLFYIITYFVFWIITIWLLSPKQLSYSGEPVSTFTMIQYCMIVCCSTFAFFRIAVNNYLNENIFKWFVIILGVIFVYNILNFDVGTLEAGEYDFSSANNMSYKLAGLFPMFLIFWDRKLFMLLLMISSMIFIVFLLKRGAMLCVATSLFTIFYFLFKSINSSISKNRIIIIKFLIIILLLVLFYVLYDIYVENDIIQNRLESGSYARENIYSKLPQIWVDSNFLYKLVGHGPFSTLTLVGIYAHNDWLEILTDFGAIGLFLYCLIPFYIIRDYKYLFLNNQQKAVFLVCLLYIFIRSTFSMCIYELETLLVFGYLGYTMGKITIINNIIDEKNTISS